MNKGTERLGLQKNNTALSLYYIIYPYVIYNITIYICVFYVFHPFM